MVVPVIALSVILGLTTLQPEFTGPWLSALIVLLLATPIGAFQIYLLTVQRVRDLTVFSDNSLVRRFLPGTWLRMIIGCGLAIFGALVVLIGLVGAGRIDWLLLALTPLVFGLSLRAARSTVQREYRPFYRTAVSLRGAAWVACGVLLVVDFAANAAVGGVPEYLSLEAAIDAQMARPDMVGTSETAAVLLRAVAIWNGAQSYLLGLASGWGKKEALAALALTTVLKSTFYLTICSFLASFMLPRREYARILAPLSSSDTPPPVDGRRLLLFSAITTVLLVGVYPVLVGQIEVFLRSRPGISQTLEKFEKIGENYVKLGTIEEINRLGNELFRLQNAYILKILTPAVDAMFHQMEGNVDKYLDWYYSVVGEYSRLGNLLAGNAERFLEEKLKETLA